MAQFQIFSRVRAVAGLSMLLSLLFWTAPLAAQNEGTGNNPRRTTEQAAQDPISGNPSKIPSPADVRSNYPTPTPPPRRDRHLSPLHSTRGPDNTPRKGVAPGATLPAGGADRWAPGNSGARMTRPFNRGPVYSPTNSLPSAATGGVGPKVSYQNGARTIKVNERTREITIVEHPTTGIYVEIIKAYSPDQMQALIRDLPELEDYIKMFPTAIDAAEISLSIGVKSKYTALTPDQLRSENPDAYNVYRRYTQTADQQQQRDDQPKDSSRGSRVIN